MLKTYTSGELIVPPDAVFSPAQWLPFDLYEWLPRFPRYAPNPFLLNHPSFYYYQIAWHSKFPVVFPHSRNYRMLRAIATNDLQEVVCLLDGGFPVDAVVDSKYGYTSLQVAAMTNHFPLIEILAIRGAQINRKDQWGNTPLMIAVANHNHEAIHSLLRNGSDLTLRNKYGLTAFDKAYENANIQQFLSSFNEQKRGFPRFRVKLELERLLRRPFWEEVKSMRVYSGKVGYNPLSRWQFDFTDFR
jgi:ankyrin repeat protein